MVIWAGGGWWGLCRVARGMMAWHGMACWHGLLLLVVHLCCCMMPQPHECACTQRCTLTMLCRAVRAVLRYEQGETKLALYGLGNIRDERLGRLFQTPGSVQWWVREGRRGSSGEHRHMPAAHTSTGM